MIKNEYVCHEEKGNIFRDARGKTDSRDNKNLGKSNANHTIQPICKIYSRYLKNPVTAVFAQIQPLRCVAVMRKSRRYITAVFGQIQALHNGWIFDQKKTNGP